ncbi:hypothetical protein NBH00_16890 [Paraconexibacter antarcticus]|uniref:RDD family protein n=1 Tax=Paraconexibacter antarcticus TaxID=2949664 RepID=A0ABY5DQP9_9ACTN|nr:hypothetical protein [Paraconexibacter antarcticus]UTI63030.1 hypothetical protein NBH00_16890 [Paraconexibacter antarcticus]
MSGMRALLPRGRALVAVDVLIAAWVVLWIVLGLAIAGEVRGLRQLSTTVGRVGVALEQTGSTVDGLSGVPLVGDRIGRTGRDISAAGDSAVASGRHSRRSIHNLSWMLGLFLAVIPSAPVLALYLPARVLDARERRTLRRHVVANGASPALRRLLARRALATLPYQVLLELDADPLGHWAPGVLEELADAELARLGLAPPRAAGSWPARES